MRSKGMRIAVGIAAPLVLLGGALFLYFFQVGPPCVFYMISGIYCVGCGGGRASVALLHGDLLRALDFNALFVLLLPLVAYYLVKIYIAYVFGKDVLPFFRIGKWTALGLLVAIAAFWILRNIPVFPFTYLAP